MSRREGQRKSIRWSRLGMTEHERSIELSDYRKENMDSIIKDLKYAFRSLLRYPMFTVVAVLTLALGIGANAAIFTVVNAVLLRPLAFQDSEQLMMIGASTPSIKLFNATKNKFLYWREHSKSFDGLTTFRSFTLPISVGAAGAQYVFGFRVS